MSRFPFTHDDMTARVAAVDFETMYSDDYSVSDMSYWHYCHHPKFRAYRVAIVTNDGFKWVGFPEDAPWERIRDYIWISHNKPFDFSVHTRLQELGKVPAWLPRFWGNSANLCAWLRVPRGLAKAVKELYDVTVSKKIRDKDMKGRQWEEYGAELQKQVDAYALADSAWALRIWMENVRKWPLHEIRISDMIDMRGLRGLCADKAGMEADMDVLRKAVHAALVKIPWHADPDEKPLSAPACAKECRKHGIPPPPSLSMTDEGLQEWEDKYGDRFPFVGAMRDYRRMNSILKKYETIYSRIKDDGRFEFSIAYLGTHTGRTSGTDKVGGRAGANMLNLPRDPFFLRDDLSVVHRKKDLKVILAYRRKHGSLPPGIAHAIDLRSKIVAAPGKKFVIADAAQIEARITNWVSLDKETLRLVKAGIGVYDAHAIALMGHVPKKDAEGRVISLKKEDPQRYALAKARELGLGFGAGHVKFLVMAPLYIDEDDFDAIFHKEPTRDQVTMYREYLEATKQKDLLAQFDAGDTYLKWTRVQSWIQVEQYRRAKKDTVVATWRRFQEELESVAAKGGRLETELPSGRVMTYFNMRKQDGDIVMQVEMGGPTKYIYGAKRLEHCLSGDSEVLSEKRGWVRLDSLRPDERVFDGEEFVSHGGLADRGERDVIDCHGLTVTPDHRFLVGDGWVEAQKACVLSDNVRYYLPHVQAIHSAPVETREPVGSPSRLAHGVESPRVGRGASPVGGSLRLREHGRSVVQADPPFVDLRSPLSGLDSADAREITHARAFRSPPLPGVEVDAPAVFESETPGVCELWRPGYHGGSPVGGEFRRVLEGHGSVMVAGLGTRPDGQRRRLLEGELPVGDVRGERVEPASQCSGMDSEGGPGERDLQKHAPLPAPTRSASAHRVLGEARRVARVFDILNCGPRTRFAVRPPGAGYFLIAHNCVQATARDYFVDRQLALDDQGIDVVLDIYDEVVCEVPADFDENLITQTMITAPEWAWGLPLGAETECSSYYKK